MNVLIGQPDTFQGHWHNVTTGGNDSAYYHATGAYMGHIGAENVYYTSDTKVQKAVTDGTNGEPRTSVETRPTNLTYQLWKRIN